MPNRAAAVNVVAKRLPIDIAQSLTLCLQKSAANVVDAMHQITDNCIPRNRQLGCGGVALARGHFTNAQNSQMFK
jgi:hypothetical protein